MPGKSLQVCAGRLRQHPRLFDVVFVMLDHHVQVAGRESAALAGRERVEGTARLVLGGSGLVPHEAGEQALHRVHDELGSWHLHCKTVSDTAKSALFGSGRLD